jgi:uncharacterized membrane protein YeaQ/YmgE (transglycosylase-associated protein family)
MDIIGVIIAGIIIGLLGKFFAPGDRDNIPLWLTVVCGVGGVLIGYYLAAALGVEATRGIDWIRWIISIAVAAVLVMIAIGRPMSRSCQVPTGPAYRAPVRDGLGRLRNSTGQLRAWVGRAGPRRRGPWRTAGDRT